MNFALLLLILPLLAALVVTVVGWVRPRWAGPLSVIFAGLTFLAGLGGWSAGGDEVTFPWAPAWDLYLTFRLDGLAALYALMATGIGLAVLVHATGYMPHHLQEERKPAKELTRFYTLMLVFMAAMVGLVMAQDLILLFVFWDVTAITSYFLIGYDREDEEARDSALMALVVTGVASIFLLIGILMLSAAYGTFSLPTLLEVVESGPYLGAAVFLMVLAALAKSAQIPFHFWLPRAMVAPTPVSAYLHSAAMVAAGVFVLQRLYPLVQLVPGVQDILLGIGLASMGVGGILALTATRLKRILAYSTISQYGYVVVMLGLGGASGAAGASFYVLSHALIKSALFLTAGAVTLATASKNLDNVGGLLRKLPWLAFGSGAAAAGLAALPLTIGFFKDELLFDAALHRGWPYALLMAFGAGLTLAYIWRFWSGIFLGSRKSEAHAVPTTITIAIVALAVTILAGGIVVEPFARLAEAAGAVTFGESTPIDPAYHFDLRPTNLLALAAYAVGVLIILSRSLWIAAAEETRRVGRRAGPEVWYQRSLEALDAISEATYLALVPSLGQRITAVLLPAALLLGLALLFVPVEAAYQVGEFALPRDLPLAIALLLTALSAFLTTRARQHLTQVLILSGVSFSLALVFNFFGAPDVAAVMILIATISAIFFFGIFMLLPGEVLGREAGRQDAKPEEARSILVAVAGGAFAFFVALGVLSEEAARESVALQQVDLAEAAHAHDVVTAILADFRGLDTMGEITVVALALVAVLTLLQRRSRQR